MRTKTLWLWSALLVASFALVAAGCGGDDESSSGTGATTGEGGTPAANQVITVNWGTEPPSLDPGLATDTTSSNILLNIMDPLVKLGDDLQPVGSAGAVTESNFSDVTGVVVVTPMLKVYGTSPRSLAPSWKWIVAVMRPPHEPVGTKVNDWQPVAPAATTP